MLHLLEGGVYMNYSELFCMKYLSLFPVYLFSHSLIPARAQGYFIHWIIIQY